jgi:hypothetical protein
MMNKDGDVDIFVKVKGCYSTIKFTPWTLIASVCFMILILIAYLRSNVPLGGEKPTISKDRKVFGRITDANVGINVADPRRYPNYIEHVEESLAGGMKAMSGRRFAALRTAILD